jgi:D-sedoheptulose 7-phosphate isomerase
MRRPTPAGQAHVTELALALERFDSGAQTADRWGRQLAAGCMRGSRLLAAGNGGSAAQA